MPEADLLRKLLAEQFGITSDIELDEAIRSSGPIDVGVFTSPLKFAEGERTA